jgi:tetratricopeptide (TPR) repeat protein
LIMHLVVVETSAKETHPPSFEEAIELIHSHSGAGDQPQRAMLLVEALSKSHPNSGYSQALLAEALSTWNLDQEGKPAELRDQIINLSDQALLLNPKLAQAYVAKARALVRASMFKEATSAIDAALKIDPTLSGAIFLRAEVYRRMGKIEEGDAWYRKFINSTSNPSRKSNGYYWLGKIYEEAAWRTPTDRKSLIAKAKESYQKMVELDPEGAWKNVNFAIFLNDHAADFEGAERYALKALSIMEFPMARYHLAAARYQQLWAGLPDIDGQKLVQGVAQVYASTNISLRDALMFPSFSAVLRARLEQLHARVFPFPVPARVAQ